ncbi:MAG: alpha/beta fold hydrolase [Gaiellaceae bacterium]
MSTHLRRGVVGLACALVAAALLPVQARAQTPLFPCHGDSGVLCVDLTVPLDHSGKSLGQVILHVEELPAKGMPRGVLFLVAGGPGQGSAATFDLGEDGLDWQATFPGYTLVAFDNRGTGSSQPLSCQAGTIADCGEELGSDRSFYSTLDHAEDIDAVREAIGVDKIALWGTSYGAQLVYVYALAHPTHVERLLLDSTPSPQGRDPFATDELRAMPPALRALCRDGGCRSITRDPAPELATLANRLASSPAETTFSWPVASGQPSAKLDVKLDGLDLLNLVRLLDLDPALAAELPASIHLGLGGQPQALQRLYALEMLGSSSEPGDWSDALFLATTCEDGPFPWLPDTPISQRQALIDAAVASLSSGATGPFGRWAAGLGTAEMCRDWPAATTTLPVPAGPLPNVPVLVLSGDLDIRTPTSGAVAVAARFPQGRVLVVPGIGHSVLTTDSSGCALRAVQGWLSGSVPPGRCPVVPPLFGVLGPFPQEIGSAAPLGATTGKPERTLAAVATTLREAGTSLYVSLGRPFPGLYGGTTVYFAGGTVKLTNYSDVPGMRLTGTLRLARGGSLRSLSGTLRVGGAAAARGTVSVVGPDLRGTLGGRRVSACATAEPKWLPCRRRAF